MKIIIATPIYPPEIGGPATYTKELVERLHAKHELTVVAYTNNEEAIPGSKLIKISKNNNLIFRLVDFFFAIYKAGKTADLLYAQNAMAAGLPTVLAGKVLNKPVILKFVGDEPWERATQNKKTNKSLHEFLAAPDAGLKINLMRMVQGWVLRQCDIVTTPSEYLGKLIAKTYRLEEKKVKTNYNAAEEITEAPFEANKKAHQILVTARLVEWKGIDGVILAVSLLKETYPDISLIIHGDGPSRSELEALAKSEGVENLVKFTGNVSRAETWQSRKNSELYILNSTYEGLPHTALTSFAAKIPIIATDIPGTNEAVYHEESGLLIPINNPVALASAITRMFEDKNLQNRLVVGASEILVNKFSWAAHLDTLESFFETVSSKPIN